MTDTAINQTQTSAVEEQKIPWVLTTTCFEQTFNKECC